MKRRAFMKSSAAIVSGLALKRCTSGESPMAPAPPALDSDTLNAVARLALPSEELGELGTARVLDGFRKWLEGFEPVAELDHPYLSEEILYGPPDPAPLWSSQLEALELEAERRHGSSFKELSREDQTAILERHLPQDLEASFPEIARAPHVACGLLAYFYASSEANDLCYRAAIERHTCRGLDASPAAPDERRS
ncbi:MAG TPA: gluconate 2-dehydrogenase subunit 3 family protein [Vicinamibacteria bacterium]|nr:gluconate 2-dehydrogenase subunit 3 family protein [Vicinamibacteria bacterium]